MLVLLVMPGISLITYSIDSRSWVRPAIKGISSHGHVRGYELGPAPVNGLVQVDPMVFARMLKICRAGSHYLIQYVIPNRDSRGAAHPDSRDRAVLYRVALDGDITVSREE